MFWAVHGLKSAHTYTQMHPHADKLGQIQLDKTLQTLTVVMQFYTRVGGELEPETGRVCQKRWDERGESEERWKDTEGLEKDDSRHFQGW